MTAVSHSVEPTDPPDAAVPDSNGTSDDPRSGGTDSPWEWVEALYLAWRDDLVFRLLHLLRSKPDAEDVAQEAFIQAMRKWRTLRDQDNKVAAAWLYRIAVNLAYTKLRERGQRREVELTESADYRAVRELVSDFVSPEQASEVSLALEVLASLSDHQREAYLLRHYFGFGTEDIAHHLEIRTSTVRVHLANAKQKIKRRLGDLGEPSTVRKDDDGSGVEN